MAKAVLWFLGIGGVIGAGTTVYSVVDLSSIFKFSNSKDSTLSEEGKN